MTSDRDLLSRLSREARRTRKGFARPFVWVDPGDLERVVALAEQAEALAGLLDEWSQWQIPTEAWLTLRQRTADALARYREAQESEGRGQEKLDANRRVTDARIAANTERLAAEESEGREDG